MAAERILVVDDEQGIRDLVRDILASEGHDVETAADGPAALAILAGNPCALVISDLRMPGMDGLELLDRIREEHPDTSVILLTAFGTIPQAVEAVRKGALDFLEKPVKSPKVLRGIVRRALRSASLPPAPTSPSTRIIREDPTSQEVFELLERVAPRDTTVLLTGESGSGKEVAARHLHALSRRASGPFVAINAAAIPPNLLESELFGHEKGAFTGAETSRAGVFENADSGTLFLDEIGEMSPDLQTKLLRVLETQTFNRLGSSTPTEVDVRVIAATNQDLKRAVREKSFREDLYYRLSVFPVRMPPLRERPADILPLARHFASELSPVPVSITQAAGDALTSHSWPGNVRELRNAIERALVLVPEGPIDAPHLTLAPARDPGPGDSTLKDMERQAVIRALEKAGGNRKRAAEILGISLRNLQYKIKQYGLKKRR
jgi:two-component system response regulator FlrC